MQEVPTDPVAFRETFLAFVKTQNQSEGYPTLMCDKCALGQFVATYGKVGASRSYWEPAYGRMIADYPPEVMDAVLNHPHVWGDLAARLEAMAG